MYDVFISYSSSDTQLADFVRSRFEKLKLKVFQASV